MSDFILELKASWVGNRSRKFYQATRGIMAPEERIALEEEFDRKLAEHNRQVAEQAWDEGYWQGINGHTGPGNPYRDNDDIVNRKAVQPE